MHGSGSLYITHVPVQPNRLQREGGTSRTRKKGSIKMPNPFSSSGRSRGSGKAVHRGSPKDEEKVFTKNGKDLSPDRVGGKIGGRGNVKDEE
jgi:hypothetical protein